MSLEANSYFYEALLKEVRWLSVRKDRRLLPFIEETARFAWQSHPGRFADGALENIAFRLGMTFGDTADPSDREGRSHPPSASRTLHVASTVTATGGHSRVLTKWIQRDLSSSHAIVLTRPTGPPPDFLRAIWSERGASLTTLDPRAPILERARELRALSRGFSRVILHQHPDDVVPVLAYARQGGCPIAMFNHAHFWFSLGSTVADMIINTMPFFQAVTERHRYPRATGMLNGVPGLERLSVTDVDKPGAKKKLGIPPEAPVALTIATDTYYEPVANYDFFKTATTLLAMRSDLHLVFVGIGEPSPLIPNNFKQNPRVHLMGLVADPRPYYEAADICLESFPVPSLGALIESAASGEALPVPAYAPNENVLRITQHLISKHTVRARTEPEYVTAVCDLIDSRDATRMKAAALRRDLVSEDERFGDQFPALYERIDSLAHAPREIPIASCSTAEDSQVLAAVTSPDVGADVGRLLSLRPALLAHIGAAVRGHETSRAALRRILERVVDTMSHRFHLSI
jgi:hypothetical protein